MLAPHNEHRKLPNSMK